VSLNPDPTNRSATLPSETVVSQPSSNREKSRSVDSAFADVNRRSLGFEEKLTARITQAIGVLNALAATYDEDKGVFRTTPKVMRDVLAAVSALLKQADKAERKLAGEIIALKRLVDSKFEEK
jgi:hypothetical protein